MKFNKKYIIITAVLLSVFIIGGCIFLKVNQEKQKKILDNKINNISNVLSEFDSKEEREDKIEVLNRIQNDESYEKEDDKVLDFYNETLTKMKKWFLDDYEKRIDENILTEVETIEDKKVLEDSKTKLNDLLSQIKNEKISNEEQTTNYTETIEKVISQYDVKINEIVEKEKAEEEAKIAKEKAEEEARAAKEKEVEVAQNNSSNNKKSNSNSNNKNNSGNSNKSSNSGKSSGGNSGNSNSGNNSGGSNNQSKDPLSGMKYTVSVDKDGNDIPGTKIYQDKQGRFYDENGNRIYSLEIELYGHVLP